MDRKPQFHLWYFVAALMGLVLVQSWLPSAAAGAWAANLPLAVIRPSMVPGASTPAPEASGISAGFSASQTSAMLLGSVPCAVSNHSSLQRSSSQSFSAPRSGKAGIRCHIRWRASRTFFSTCRFSHPAAGLQNSGSKT